MGEAFRTLYSQGGIPRFYKGLLPALFQARTGGKSPFAL